MANALCNFTRNFSGPIFTLNYDERIENACSANLLKRYPQSMQEYRIESPKENLKKNEKYVYHLQECKSADLFILKQDGYIEKTDMTLRALQVLADQNFLLIYLGMKGAFDDPDLHPHLIYEKSKSVSGRVCRGRKRPSQCIIAPERDLDSIQKKHHHDYIPLAFKPSPLSHCDDHSRGMPAALMEILYPCFATEIFIP